MRAQMKAAREDKGKAAGALNLRPHKSTARAPLPDTLVDTAPSPVSNSESTVIARLRDIGEQDPNLALVALRIEIEKRLAARAEEHGVDASGKSTSWLLHELGRREILDIRAMSGVAEFISIGNKAAHGAKVDPAAAEWVMEMAPVVLAAL
jgi:hypothetical protein